MRTFYAGLLVALLLAACGGGEGSNVAPVDTGTPSADVTADTGLTDLQPPPDFTPQDTGFVEDTAPEAGADVPADLPVPDGTADAIGETVTPPTCDWLAEMAVPAQHGLVYVGHFLSTELAITRIDGDVPEPLADLEMGQYTHDLALDTTHNLLAVVQDVARQVTLLQLTPPVSPSSPAVEPSPVATIAIDNGDIPRFATFYEPASRLYVLAGLPPESDKLGVMNLHVFDVASPAEPKALGLHEVSASVSWAVDPLAGVLFLVGLTDDTLYLYDITTVEPTLRPGTPIDLLGLYPEENNTAFQARNLTLDPWRGRVLAARAQGAFSEVIAFDYPVAIATEPGVCPTRVDHDSLVPVADFFDLSIPVEDRPNLLDAFRVLPDTETGHAFLMADAWNGTGPSAILVGLTKSLGVAAGCGAFEGFGCWLQYILNGQPGSFLRTDGAACLDSTRKIVAATSIAPYSEEEPGSLHLYRYEADLQMSPWLQAGDKSTVIGALPVAAICY